MSIKERLAVADSLLREASDLRRIIDNPAYSLDERLDALRGYMYKGIDATETLLGKGWEQTVTAGTAFVAAGTAALLVGEGRALYHDLSGRTAQTEALNRAGRDYIDKLMRDMEPGTRLDGIGR